MSAPIAKPSAPGAPLTVSETDVIAGVLTDPRAPERAVRIAKGQHDRRLQADKADPQFLARMHAL